MTKIVVAVSPTQHRHIHDYAKHRGLSVAGLVRHAVSIGRSLASSLLDGWILVEADERTFKAEVAEWGRQGWQVKIPNFNSPGAGPRKRGPGVGSRGEHSLNVAVSETFRAQLWELTNLFRYQTLQAFVMGSLAFEEECFRSSQDGNKRFLVKARLGAETEASGPPPGAWQVEVPGLVPTPSV